MAALTATGWTVTINDQWRSGKKRYTRATLTLASGSDTYPAGGIPLPTFDKFGFYKFIDAVTVYGDSYEGGYAWEYAATAHKLAAYQVGATGTVLSQATAGTTIHTTERNFNVIAVGG